MKKSPLTNTFEE